MAGSRGDGLRDSGFKGMHARLQQEEEVICSKILDIECIP